jgi:hypothetical protein
LDLEALAKLHREKVLKAPKISKGKTGVLRESARIGV